jgi:hypothetical protein
MSLNYLHECPECGRKAVKEEYCAKCRQKPRKPLSRAETNTRAAIEQSMTKEQATWLYNDAVERLLINDTDQEAWYDKRRARARLFREDIDVNTLI